MNPSALFITRPVATTLLTIAVVLAGFFAFLRLPVAPLPQVDYPSITVSANIPGPARRRRRRPSRHRPNAIWASSLMSSG
jgi:multidrug efflux pump subunit AcrB